MQRAQQASGLRGWWRRRRAAGQTRAFEQQAALRLYHATVAAARQKHFYTALGVPDSREGRFEMIGLFAALVMRRLRESGPAGQAVAQLLFDLMFADMDRNLREMGVGDLSVGKHVKNMAAAFLARAQAIDEVLDAADVARIAAVLRRNLYDHDQPPSDSQVDALAGALLRQWRALATLPAEALAGADVTAISAIGPAALDVDHAGSAP